MDDEIDLRDIFRVLWKRRLLIIGVFVAAVLVAGVISLSMLPVYTVSTIIAVGNFEDPVYTSQASARSIMLSDEFLQEVFGPLGPNATGSEFMAFKGSVKVEPVKGSDKLIEISVETPERQEGLKAVEKMVWLYANRSEDSYNKQKKILSDQLAVTQERLDVIDMEINQTREALQDMQDSSGPSEVQAEMRFSRTLDRLSGMETERSAQIDRSLDLQKQLELIKHLEVVSPAREPVSPIGPRKILIVGIAGMLGLMVGIFAAFLREALGRPAE
jgi:uncharacterized protein involved in exopolysaccharide biosynthesis